MSTVITSEMASSYIQYSLTKNTYGYNRSMDQLASGSKITQVADNPIGVAQIAQIDAQVSANKSALSNVSIGNDLLSQAEGGLDLAVTNIQRIRELAMQAASETYNASNKDAILSELTARINEINRTADSVNFNGVKLLDGSATNLAIQTGSTGMQSLNVGSGLIDIHSAVLGIDIPAGTTGATWTTSAVESYLSQLDGALGTLINAKSLVGSYSNRLDYVANNLSNISMNLTSSRSTLSDTDTAQASADLVKYQILQQAAVNILIQANQMPARAVSLLSPSR